MDRVQMAELNHVAELSEVYEALDNCIEFDRILARLARVDTEAYEDWSQWQSQVHRICARVERRLGLDS